MITDTKKPITLEPKGEGKRGYTVTWDDGKKDTLFDEVHIRNVNLAINVGASVNFTKEKNEKGYWNIQTLTLETPNAPATPVDYTKDESNPFETLPKEKPVDPRNRSIERQVSVKLALEFCDGTLLEKLEGAEIIYQWISR